MSLTASTSILERNFSCSNKLIAAIDQGTSSSRFLLFSTKTCQLVTYHQIEIKKIFPNEGWVEQDPLEIYQSVIKCIEVVAQKLPDLGYSIADICCVGLTNQRESTILWERTSGKPLYNSIVWHDNRTSDLVEKMIDCVPGRDPNWLKSKTGLPISTYFSALKIKWLIENVPEVRKSLSAGTLMFGTVDSWLLWNLTGKHLTDVTNASRTLLMDLETLQWDPWLCNFFKIPMSILPEIQSSSSMFGEIQHGPLRSIPITGVIGDQNAALVGQKCLSVGQIKVTYGTGAFLMQNIGPGPLKGAYKNVTEEAQRKLLTTVAFKLGDQLACYALEGSIAIAGAAITWLRDNLELIDNYNEVENLARMDSSSGGLYFVPAFQGLYAPYWDTYASGLIIGISQFSRKCHLIRATLEGIAYQSNDILCLMGNLRYGIRVDGGMSSNNLLCQILADVTGNMILRAKMVESTAFGAALVSSYHYGLWDQLLNVKSGTNMDKTLTNNLIKPTTNGHLPNGNHLNNDIKKTINGSTTNMMNIGDNYHIVRPMIHRKDSTFNYYKHQLTSLLSSSSSNSTLSLEPITDDIQIQYDLFIPEFDDNVRIERVNNWRNAVRRSRKWVRVEQNEQKHIEYLRLSTLPMTFFIICSLDSIFMDRISENESMCSESSIGSIRSLNGSHWDRIPNSYLLNPTDPLLDNHYESIISKVFSNSPFNDLEKSYNLSEAFQKLEELKQNSKLNKESKQILFDINNIHLTDEDFNLGCEDDFLIDNEEDLSKQCELAFGTALNDHNTDHFQPYIEFNLPIDQQRERLHQFIVQHNSKELQKKVTLTENIEQQLTIQPFRVSRRQRKKIMAEQRKQTLPQWFDMPRVEEISKEQEKDLLALRMRRVWNPKQFYKKSSQIVAGDNSLDEQSKYFQIGTIQETAADFYSGRLTRRERKQTILDELMHDAQLQSYNKRKIQYAMTRNSRLKIMMKRAKLRRMKKRIKERKEEKVNRFNVMAESNHDCKRFKTFDF